MNGVHDMGGLQGFGSVIREENEPVFHEDWERKMRAMVVCLNKNKIINLDEVRYAMERIKPDHYLTVTYYERWYLGLLILLLEKGILVDSDMQDIKRKFAIDENEDLLSALTLIKYYPKKEKDDVNNLILEPVPKFTPGEKVNTKLINSKGHIRLPSYAKGKSGIVKEISGNYKLPESNVYSQQACIEPVYLVEFQASDLWGEQVPKKDKVLIDLWESYLVPVNA